MTNEELQSVHLCNVCILNLKKALDARVVMGMKPLEFGCEPYASLKEEET